MIEDKTIMLLVIFTPEVHKNNLTLCGYSWYESCNLSEQFILE